MSIARKLGLGALVCLVTASLSAAADLPGGKPPLQPLAPAPVATWTGFYVGAQGGTEISTTGKSLLAMGGLSAGYLWQFDHFVLGVQGDVNWRPYGPRSAIGWVGANTGTVYVANNHGVANFVSFLDGRAGYSIGDNLLLFLSGGLAFSELGLNTTVTGLAGPNSGAYGQNSVDDLRVGWTLGGGAEYRLTQNWSIEGQYRYYRLPTVTLVTNAYLGGVPVTGFVDRSSSSGNFALAGVNYHF